MDEKQLQFLYDNYGKDKGFKDFAEFESLMSDSASRKSFFDVSNKDLGFKSIGEFENILGLKKKDGGGSSIEPSPSPSQFDQLKELKKQLLGGQFRPTTGTGIKTSTVEPVPAQGVELPRALQIAKQKAETQIAQEQNAPKLMSVYTKPTYKYPEQEEKTAQVLGYKSAQQKEESKEERKQKEHAELQKATNEFYNTTAGKFYFNVIQPIARSADDQIAHVGGTILRATGMDDAADALVEHMLPENQYKGTIAAYTPEKLQGNLFNDGKVNWTKVPSTIVRSLSDMAWLLAEASPISKGASAIGIGEKAATGAGLYASSYLNTRESYYQEGKQAGLKGDQLDMFATGAAGLTSALELISPNEMAFKGFKSKLAKEYAKKIAEGVPTKVALKESAKELAKEGFIYENVQELSQLTGDKVARTISDLASGQDNFGDQFNWQKSKDEILETVVITPIVTMLAGAPKTIAHSNATTYDKSLMYNAAQTPEKVLAAMDKQVADGTITPEQATEGKRKLNTYVNSLEQVKKLGYSEDQTMRMAYAVYNSKLNQPTNTAIQADPVLNQAFGKEVAKDKEALTTEIKQIGMGVPDVGAEIGGEQVSIVLSNIGDKGAPISSNLVDAIGDADYRVDEVDVKELYNSNPEFKDYVDNYQKKKQDGDGLIVPAVIDNGKILDGRSRLAEQYLAGKDKVKVFNKLNDNAINESAGAMQGVLAESDSIQPQGIEEGKQEQEKEPSTDAGNSNISSQERLTKELNDVLFSDTTDIVDKAQKSLEKTGVKIEMVEDPEEFDRQVEQLGGQKGMEGVFVSNEGRILLNKSKLKDGVNAGTIIWHESSHPVINIVRNTNPELYKQVVSGLNQLKDTPGVAEALKWAADNYTGEGVVEDESVVETIARIADGSIDLSGVPKDFKQKFIDFINTIAKALGLGQVIDDTDKAAFQRLATDVADALKTGRDISTVVGQENATRFSNNIQARVGEKDENPLFFENIKKFANESSFENKLEFKKALQEISKKYLPELKKKYGKNFNPSVYDDATKQYLSDILTKEAFNAIDAHPEAIGWYDEKTRAALAAISTVHPEIATDNEARGAFILPLAVMSNGNKVDKNFELAEQQYQYYKDNARFNPNGDFGAQQDGIRKSLKLINGLLENGVSMAEINNFLTSKHIAGDLKYRKKDGKLGDLVSGELAGEPVFGAVILGPKIGNGFYMNLWGEFEQLTMDRWFMRTWGRLTGTLIEDNAEKIKAGKVRLKTIIEQAKKDTKARDILRNTIGTISNLSVTDFANAIEKASAKRDLRNILSSYPVTNELRKAANSLAKNLRGEKEAPSNGAERKFIRSVFSDVQSRLKQERGIDITMADLQAVLWYPEKILYESFKEGESYEDASEGYTEDSAPDYFNAAKKLALKLGATNEQINQAVSAGRGSSEGRTGGGNTGAGETVSRNDQEVLKQIRTISGGEPELTKGRRVQGSVGNREASVFAAPYYDFSLRNQQGDFTLNAKAARESADYQQYQKDITEIAGLFGVKLQDVQNIIGGFENEKGNKIVEIAAKSDIEVDDFNKAVQFAAIIGSIAPETQESTIAARYVEDKAPEHNADEYVIKVSDADLAIKALTDLGIYNFSVNENTNEVTLLNIFAYPTEGIDNILDNFANKLDEYEVEYTAATKSAIQSEYIDYTRRQEIIADIQGDAIYQQGGQRLRDVIAKASQRNEEFIKGKQVAGSGQADNNIQASKGKRIESDTEFKLASFVMRKLSEGESIEDIEAAIASVAKMPNDQIKALVSNPEEYLRKAYPGQTEEMYQNLINRAMIQNIYRDPKKAVGSYTIPQEKVTEFYNKSTQKKSVFKETVKDFKNKYLNPAKGLPDWILAMKDFASGTKNIEIARAVKTIELLKAEAKKIGFTDWNAFAKAMVVSNKFKLELSDETGLVMFDPVRASENKPLDDAPAVVPDEIKALPASIVPFVFRMRNQIDGLTRDLIGAGYVTPEQAVNMEKNIGQYVNRAYRMYNERGYKPTPESMVEALKYLTDQRVNSLIAQYQPKIDKADGIKSVGRFKGNTTEPLNMEEIEKEAMELAKRDLEDILNKKKNPYFNVSNTDSRNTGILKEKMDIPEPIRKLMGEYTDPGTVFVMTVAKQAALKASSEYLSKLREFGMGTIFFEGSDPKRPASHSVEIASRGTESKSPLGGLYTTPEIAEALESVDPTYNELTNKWMKLVGAVRWGKTVGSVVTQVKNFESNIGFAVLNGMFLSGANADAIESAGKYLKGQYTKGEIDAITEKVIKLGLVGQSVGARELKEMFGSGDINAIALDYALNPEGKWGKKAAKKLDIFSAANKAYRMGDDFWKVYAYMTERSQLAKARFDVKYEDLSTERQDKVDVEASERVKNTWPTYDRVWEAAKYVSKRAPIFGNFISFQAESLRVLANSVDLAMKDMKDPELAYLGVRRMIGITTYASIRAALTYAAAHAAGIAMSGLLGAALGDEDEEDKKDAIKSALPVFMRTGDLLVLKTNEPHKFIVYNISSLDPYGILPSSLNALTDGREGIFGNQMEPGVAAMFAEFFSSFLEQEMTFKASMGLLNNVNPDTKEKIILDSDDMATAFTKAMKYIYSTAEPSTQKLIERGMERGWGPEGASLVGARPYDVDLHKSFSFMLSNLGKEIEDINKEYNKIKFSLKSTPDQISEAQAKAEDKKAYEIEKINQIYKNFIKLGASQVELDKMIKERSGVKVTGFDKPTKYMLMNGVKNKEILYK